MERAAAGVAEAALALPQGREMSGAALCGAGNNGGDEIAAARLLFEGPKVRAFLVGDYEKLTQDALEETRRPSECGGAGAVRPGGQPWAVWGCDVVIDALFGVGLRPGKPLPRRWTG